MSQSQPAAHDDFLPVLVASVHDIRYFAALLRGVNFVNRATVTVTERGLTITVEESRTLLGASDSRTAPLKTDLLRAGTAFIFSEVFNEYVYHPEPPSTQTRPPKKLRPRKKPPKSKKAHRDPSSSSETETDTDDDDAQDEYDPEKEGEDDEDDEELGLVTPENAAFEIPLNTLIECLNIFGTAGPSTGNLGAASESAGGGKGKGRGRGGGNAWQHALNDDTGNTEEGQGRKGHETFFGGSEKKTGMRLSYPGGGYPLTLIIAEDASGPTTTCDITTFDPEPHLELNFDNSKTVLKIILKSSWLRDALSEIDPSCDKLTFIGNPALGAGGAESAAGAAKKKSQRAPPPKPMLRIQATGTFGSTEMDYPNDREVLETFECTETVRFSYRLGHILRTIKALQTSTKTSLRIDEEGLLSLQFLMPSPKPARAGGGTDAFIEFRCLALDDQY